MIKKTLVLFCIILIIPSVLAINLDVKKQSANEVSILSIDSPTIFNLEITNNEKTDEFTFYNLLGFIMEPSENVKIEEGQTKNISVIIYPRENFNYKGYYVLKYFIKGEDESVQEEQLTINFIELKDAFEIGSESIDPKSNKITLYLKNKENIYFKEINATFTSAFFNIEKTFELTPYEKKEFEITLNKEDFKKLMAGFYTLDTQIVTSNQKAEIEGMIQFVEENILTTISKEYGLFVHTKTIKKTNEGNLISSTTTQIKKNIISRLFTSFSHSPDIIERKNFIITYTWNKSLKPGESLDIKVKTNWFYPFILALLVVIITIITKQYSLKPLELTKKVHFVRTKGGELALKVTIKVKARKYVNRINIIDRLPPLVKFYEKFGVEAPSHVDEKNRRLEWEIDHLEQGEARVLSYIVYSKIGVLGKFSLPSATAVYEIDGKVYETISNKAFFVSEQQIGEEKDEW